MKNTVKVTFRFPKELFEKFTTFVPSGKRSAFLNDAILEYLKRNEAKKQPTPALP